MTTTTAKDVRRDSPRRLDCRPAALPHCVASTKPISRERQAGREHQHPQRSKGADGAGGPTDAACGRDPSEKADQRHRSRSAERHAWLRRPRRSPRPPRRRRAAGSARCPAGTCTRRPRRDREQHGDEAGASELARRDERSTARHTRRTQRRAGHPVPRGAAPSSPPREPRARRAMRTNDRSALPAAHRERGDRQRARRR